MLAANRFDNGLRHTVTDQDPRTLTAFHSLPRYFKHGEPQFGHRNFPLPSQTAHNGIARASLQIEEGHPRQMIWQPRQQLALLGPGEWPWLALLSHQRQQCDQWRCLQPVY